MEELIYLVYSIKFKLSYCLKKDIKIDNPPNLMDYSTQENQT